MNWLFLIFLGFISYISPVFGSNLATVEGYLKSSPYSSGVIRVTDKNFEQIVTGPRDHTLVLLLTASHPGFGCGLCIEYLPDFQIVGDSWATDFSDYGHEGVYFAIADVSDNRETFKKLKLTSVPHVWIYTPTKEATTISEGHITYQLEQGDHAQNLANFLSQVVGRHFPVHKPIRWDVVIGYASLTFLSVFIFKEHSGKVVAIITNTGLWAVIASSGIIILTSGYMYNQIRHTPFLAFDGEITRYFEGGFQGQFGVETQIIGLVYAVLASAFVLLCTKAKQINDSDIRNIVVISLTLVILLGYSSLVCIFHFKNGGYPYYLLKLFT